MSRSVKSEIDKRTTDVGKAAALQARKVAVLELVADLIQEAVDLMKSEGFTAPAVVSPQPPPVGVTVVKEAQLVAAPAPQIKNPCAACGQEAMGTEDLPDGTKKYLCAVHYKARLIEKQEEHATQQLMGSQGTLYKRPTAPVAAPAKKIVIQADPLLGVTGNGETLPPVNHLLDDADD